MSGQTWIGILYVVVGSFLIILSFPLLAGRVSRNRWYGFRLPKSYESEQTWQLINRYGARHLIRWASAFAGLGAYLIIAPDASEIVFTWIVIGAPLLLLVPVVLTVRYAQRLP